MDARSSSNMRNRKQFSRFALVLILFLALCTGMFSPRLEQAVEAMPLAAADELNVFISEFRTRGPNGEKDEFVEIFNASMGNKDITGWRLFRSGCASGDEALSDPIGATILAPGQYYLFTRATGEYSGSTNRDALLINSYIDNDGGISLKDNLGNIIDQVGMCSTTLYKEGTILSPMTNDVEQSYERKSSTSFAGCKDTDVNSADFVLNSASSNPQNFFSALSPCLVVTNVRSMDPDGAYTSGQTIDIEVMFSNNVNVTGSPTLTLETGSVDQQAVYVAGTDGDNTLTFRYTVANADSSPDLDYVSANSLSLNGGTITGAIGDATLVLPKPGTGAPGSGSLAVNSNIQIDASGTPSILSIKRQTPTSTTTNASSLTFRVAFDEWVQNVDALDFSIAGGTTATISAISPITGSGFDFDVTVSGGDLTAQTFNGTVGLNIAGGATITDLGGNSMPTTPEPSIDETYTVDNTPPSISSLTQASTQTDPSPTQPVLFTIVFSEVIDTTSFVVSDINSSGSTTPGIAWTIKKSGDNKTFTLSATASSGVGLIVASIFNGSVKDLAGNTSVPFLGSCADPEPNNCVTLSDITGPAVTIDQASTQSDPTSTLPIDFTVRFSEVINTASFTTADITQNGTAAGITWNITNIGDNKTFTLSATAAGATTIAGTTIVPSIAANRVLDLSGNNNTASTSTDNTVTYKIFPTPTPLPAGSVVINEVAWAGTASTLTADEWIELYNPTSNDINITGWILKSNTDGSPTVQLIGIIPAGGYFLLEKDDDDTVSNITADQFYTGDLTNSGERLTLNDPFNNVIDTANNNGGGWPAGSISTFGTMERVTGSTDLDTSWFTNTGATRNGKNADGGDIRGTPRAANTVRATATPRPGTSFVATSTPFIFFGGGGVTIDPRPVINEILPRPGFDWNQDGKKDVFDEFIEIKNLTSINISLSGWSLKKVGSGSFFSLPNISLTPGQRVVFYSKETNLLLSDGGETINLVSPTGQIYDSYTYTIARTEDRSICRMPDTNVFGSWYEDCIPTPEFPNTREGSVPTSADGSGSPVCDLPDTIPLDFFIPECNGYGAAIWNPFYWDFTNWLDKLWIQQVDEKWRTYIE